MQSFRKTGQVSKRSDFSRTAPSSLAFCAFKDMESRRRDQRFSGLLDLGLIGRKAALPINPGADHHGVQNPGHVAGFCYDGIPGSVFNFLGSAT